MLILQLLQTEIRKKYGVPEDAKVLLHVGHLKAGRNIDSLLSVDESVHVVLVVSTLTKKEWDETLRAKLVMRSNITIIDTFVADIEQIYQMSDIYFFPVQEKGNCIDMPLSVLEAAACNLPVLATPYGELKELMGKEGFYEITTFESESLNRLIQQACEKRGETRSNILEYDWTFAVKALLM